MLHHVPPSTPAFAASLPPTAAAAPPGAGRRRWTAGELTEAVAALATLRTSEIAKSLGVNPKALRSVLRRQGISLRALREQAKKPERCDGTGLVVRRSSMALSAAFGAEALADLPDSACRWPLGDPSEPEFKFCGSKAMKRSAYCTHHANRAVERKDGHDR